MSPDRARRILGINDVMFNALTVSGLLGVHNGINIPLFNVISFRDYGTQWDSGKRRDIGETVSPTVKNDPDFRKVIVEQRTTILHFLPSGIGLDKVRHDTQWIAQFYIRPNPLFYTDANALALVGPIGLQLGRKADVLSQGKVASLYPDREGRFAMAMVFGGEGSGPAREAMTDAYNLVGPILDKISSIYHVPLPVAQTIIVGIPSGVIYRNFPRIILPTNLDADLLNKDRLSDLDQARALYREALSSSSPFHEFMSLWRCWENLVHIRKLWRQRHSRRESDKSADVIVVQEKFPDEFAYQPFGCKSFGAARSDLYASFRNALAHGEEPKTGAVYKDFNDVYVRLPIIRYMARTTMLNVEACLNSTT